MEPVQTARHVKSEVTAHMLSWINRRHVNLKLLDAAQMAPCALSL
ncbi:MAG: hypothetical protein K0S11_112 [Gammaproteobacteria bacterium]|nr:hypothetical protein [Gammaproteobacteria bacterium]